MKLGDIIRKYRDEHNFMSQREFARKCQLSNAQISLLESGIGTSGEPFMPSYRTISKVAKGMGMSPEMLIAQCDDFDIDITDDSRLESNLVEKYIEEQLSRSPDEEMLLQAYRMIPAEHRIEAMQAVLAIKMKYEN